MSVLMPRTQGEVIIKANLGKGDILREVETPAGEEVGSERGKEIRIEELLSIP